MKHAFIAVDFGGGSGRVIAGTISAGALSLSEVHRFTNRQVKLGRHIYWNFLSLFDEMITGIRKAVDAGFHICGIGIDTWGVDFGLIDRNGNLLANPICYRDNDCSGCAEEFFSNHPTPQSHYAVAGIQIMDINSVFRLARMQHTSPHLIEAADRLLFMPDLFSYFLTATATNEYTIASSSGLLDAAKRSWNMKLIDSIGLPRHLFGDIVMPGTQRGTLTHDIRRRIGVDYEVPVFAVGSHDTASAVSTVTGTYSSDAVAYLSSGTWSLLGVTIPSPILTEPARLGGFTNEGAIGGSIRFLQNITGLWILQQLMHQWQQQGLTTDYPTLLAEAEASDFSSVIDVDDPSFHSPESMSVAIDSFCKSHSLPAPLTQGEYVRCLLLSLAQRYKRGIDTLNSLLPYPVRKLQIIGGGSRNNLLNRLTAEATGLEVTAGPVEATAIGNILTQATAAGVISSMADIHTIN